MQFFLLFFFLETGAGAAKMKRLQAKLWYYCITVFKLLLFNLVLLLVYFFVITNKLYFQVTSTSEDMDKGEDSADSLQLRFGI